MSHTVRFDKLLPADLSSAKKWYENQQAGLGDRFAAYFYAVVNSIILHPFAWPLFRPFASRGIRHRLLPKFPYAIYYRVNAAEIFVFLLFHEARDPQRLRRAISRRSS